VSHRVLNRDAAWVPLRYCGRDELNTRGKRAARIRADRNKDHGGNT